MSIGPSKHVILSLVYGLEDWNDWRRIGRYSRWQTSAVRWVCFLTVIWRIMAQNKRAAGICAI